MDRGYYTIIAILIVGLFYGLTRKRSSQNNARGGWIGLGVLVFILGGLFAAEKAGSESLTWFFGLALMAALPIMFFLAVGSKIGQILNKWKDQ